LRCRADGDPAPSTRCARQGGTSDGDTQHGATRDSGRVVTRADGGRYVCRATNRHGVAVRSVTVTVECECDTGEGT
ncbi:ICAM5 protein, partial [Certhia brachydactyla]|nr:ICAM5 protein [Certhia brachydactyla]